MSLAGKFSAARNYCSTS